MNVLIALNDKIFVFEVSPELFQNSNGTLIYIFDIQQKNIMQPQLMLWRTQQEEKCTDNL